MRTLESPFEDATSASASSMLVSACAWSAGQALDRLLVPVPGLVQITTEQELETVRRECEHVWVDYDDTGTSSGPVRTAELQPRPIEQEIDRAQEIHALAGQAVSSLFEDIRMGAALDGGAVKEAVDGCVESILRNPDASVWLTRIKAKHEPIAQHSMNVATLSIVMGRAMGLPARELKDLGVCAMLHDVGMTRVSSEILARQGPLGDEELAEVRRHTRYGRDLLLTTRSVMSGAADVAHAHHERPDGRGYPRGLSGDSIPLYAKIISITEAYDTMTTPQHYRQTGASFNAIRELYSLLDQQFDAELVISFIEAIGIFPPGSLIEMTTGEIGIVLSNTGNKLRPRVIMILDADHEPMAQRVVDLSYRHADDSGSVYHIITTHPDGSFGIDVAEFRRGGLRIE